MDKRKLLKKLLNWEHKTFHGLVGFDENGEINHWSVDGIPEPTEQTWIDLQASEVVDRKKRHWAKIRARRNQLLRDSDFIMLSDCPKPAPKITAWTIYRQALRDLPSTQEDPVDIVFPNDPDYVPPEPE